MLMHILNIFQAFMVSAVLRSVPLLLCTGAVTVLMRRSSASARSFVWRAGLFGLLSLPILSAVLPTIPISIKVPFRRSEMSPVSSLIVPHAPVNVPANNSSFASPDKVEVITTRKSTSIPTRSQSYLFEVANSLSQRSMFSAASLAFKNQFQSVVLLVIWMVIALAMAVRLASSLFALRDLKACAVPVEKGTEHLAVSVLHSMHVKRSVQIYVGGDKFGDAGPMTWGSLRPIILLPANAELWPDDRLRSVLSHEAAHIVRGDWAVQMLASVATALFWFNPLVWIMSRQIQREHEHACDDYVINAGIPAADYAAHLLEVVRLRKSKCAPLASLSMAQSTMLEERLRALLDPLQLRNPASRTFRVLAVVGLVVGTAPLAALQISAKRTSFLTGKVEHVTLLGNRAYLSPLFSSPDDGAISVGRDSVRPLTSVFRIPPLHPVLRSASSGSLDILRSAFSGHAEGQASIKAGGQNVPSELRGVAWGPIASGIQTGIRMIGFPRKVKTGLSVTVRVYLRNATEHSLARAYTYRMPEIWDRAGNAIQDTKDGYGRLGEPGAILAILPPGDTILIGDQQRVIDIGANEDDGKKTVDQHGIYHVAVRFLYGIPGQYRARGLEKDKVTEAEALKAANIILSKNDPIYRVNVNLVTAAGRRHSLRTAAVGAYGYMEWNSLYSPAPRLDAINVDSDILWSGAVEIKVGGEGGTTKKASDNAIGVAEIAPLDSHVAWGAASNGLQAGLYAPGRMPQHVMGQALKYEYLIRNVSKEEVVFEHAESPGTAGSIPDVTTAGGKAVTTGGEPILASMETRHVTLKPGESVVLGHTFMGLLTLNFAPGRVSVGYDRDPLHEANKAYTYMNARVGQFKMRTVDTVFVPKQKHPSLALQTGWMDFEVVGHIRNY